MISIQWRRRAYSRADEQQHERDEQENGMMSYFLFFIATVLAGTINALAGGGGLITFPLLMLVVTPVTADATSAVALFFAYPAAVWRTGTSWQVSSVADGYGCF
jgi:apolipoprotein N-acyltransferase